jgi:hypothetical protein
MEWFYALGNEQKGPVSEQEFQQLLAQGTVNAQTLVWREGLAAWQPYGAITLSSPSIPPVPGGVTCAECGKQFPPSDVIPLSGRMYCAICKPVVLQRLQEGLPASSGSEEIRKQYLKHEASVKSVGILYYLGGIVLTVMGVASLVAVGSSAEAILSLVVGGLLFVFGVGQFIVGYGLRRLKSWARIPTAILSGFGLLGFPIGTIINAYIMYLVLCKKGKMVFSEEYRDVMAQTPHIKYRTSIVVWILLGLIVFAIAAALILPLLARMKAGR